MSRRFPLVGSVAAVGDGRRNSVRPQLFASVRTRILAIALIPSIVLATAIAGVVTHLVGEARQDRDWADALLRSTPHAVEFNEALLQERRLTMLRAAQRDVDDFELKSQRSRVDFSGRALMEAITSLNDVIPGTFGQFGEELGSTVRDLTALRSQVDAGSSSVEQVYKIYSRLAGAGAIAIDVMVRHAPDIDSAVALSITAELFRAADSMSAAHALVAAVATDDGLDSGWLREFVRRVDAYHAGLDVLAQGDDARVRPEIRNLTTTDEWRQLIAFEDSLIERDGQESEPATKGLSASSSDRGPAWAVDRAGSQPYWEGVVDKLRALWRTCYEDVQRRATDLADSTQRTSIVGGGIALTVAVLAFLSTLWLANQLSQRLRRLRRQTLALSESDLPAIMARIRAGERVDVESALPVLKFGRDEIGQVADAFDFAQRTAVAAAVTEANTREALNAVFLNLAHRSQLMAHRQLEVLDAAEAREEDPALMRLLFQLDHLATRERRNAENLIILGGERPGRKWRNPVPLRDIVRSAIAETQDYARVRATRLPEVRVNGGVVADVIHLLAELIDNATSFSPPDSRVEASGNLVGKGVAVEIVDQGLGMPDGELARLNELLRNTPDFGLMQLSSDSRLGLIVVSVLASRNGIKVRLVESDYGGIKAVVLIPSTLLATETEPKSSSEKMDVHDTTRIAFDSPPVSAVPPGQEVGADSSGSKASRDFLTTPLVTRVQETPTPAASQSSTFDAETPTPPEGPGVSGLDTRPPLPRRRRQQSLAPELAESSGDDIRSPEAAGTRSAEQARDLMSAIATGTRQGRQVRSDLDDNYEGSS
ncbi:nitrate- and nitrite sensing domain-containing protein [Nocardia xishanensis]|uniref:histidine kinase n=1 Tax=Nocardia xishanensis TaxID=238964 RepID=A0ABW7XBQ7_9NOCA